MLHPAHCRHPRLTAIQAPSAGGVCVQGLLFAAVTEQATRSVAVARASACLHAPCVTVGYGCNARVLELLNGASTVSTPTGIDPVVVKVVLRLHTAVVGD